MPCKILLKVSKIRYLLFVPWIYPLTQFFILGYPPSQATYSSKRFTINNHVQIAKSNGESTFQQVLNLFLSVRKWTAGCLSSLNLQTFGKPMTVTTCTKSMVGAMFTAQKTSCHKHAQKVACRSPKATPLIFLVWIWTFPKCSGRTRIYSWIYFRLQSCKWKSTAVPKAVIYCLDAAEFIDRVLSPMGLEHGLVGNEKKVLLRRMLPNNVHLDNRWLM